jgi:hypothetical protein
MSLSHGFPNQTPGASVQEFIGTQNNEWLEYVVWKELTW